MSSKKIAQLALVLFSFFWPPICLILGSPLCCIAPPPPQSRPFLHIFFATHAFGMQFAFCGLTGHAEKGHGRTFGHGTQELGPSFHTLVAQDLPAWPLPADPPLASCQLALSTLGPKY